LDRAGKRLKALAACAGDDPDKHIEVLIADRGDPSPGDLTQPFALAQYKAREQKKGSAGLADHVADDQAGRSCVEHSQQCLR